jgi:hypothetical protein
MKVINAVLFPTDLQIKSTGEECPGNVGLMSRCFVIFEVRKAEKVIYHK